MCYVYVYVYVALYLYLYLYLYVYIGNYTFKLLSLYKNRIRAIYAI